MEFRHLGISANGGTKWVGRVYGNATEADIPVSTHTLTDREEAEAKILKRMLKKRAAATKQLTAEELSQVVPPEKRGIAKSVLNDCVQDVGSPISKYPSKKNADLMLLRSLEEAADRLEELTGERINYRQYTHSLRETPDPEEIEIEVEYDHLETVKHTLSEHEAASGVDVEYEYPPVVTAIIDPERIEEVRSELRDRTNGDVP